MNEKVAEGTWHYDGDIPRRIAVYRKEARLSSSRFNRDTEEEPSIDESRPIPETKDGFLYYCLLTNSGEHLSLDEAKAWADAQPWGPVKWDDDREPTFPELPGWHFTLIETSSGVYRAEGFHDDGRSVSRFGHDLPVLIKETAEDARNLPRRK
ncbi:hypothetical protein [Bradyrhizobium yuanmingense]|uniref:hypothetical protein n=1 Tax=Bradyrhizobium yuanmingense TaxID=108015 RepID=UPI0023BA198A|nr:hypothetical protein [Bradyrhizobium yuanmingense]MDF0583536.1 hypothetical protein [Bradyrhizobium yuanmingense]